MNVETPFHLLPGQPVSAVQAGPATKLMALQIVPAVGQKSGGLAVAGASGTALGAAGSVRLGGVAGGGTGAGMLVAVPDDSFATRASVQADLLPPAHAITQHSVDVPGFLLLALAVTGFAVRQLGQYGMHSSQR